MGATVHLSSIVCFADCIFWEVAAEVEFSVLLRWVPVEPEKEARVSAGRFQDSMQAQTLLLPTPQGALQLIGTVRAVLSWAEMARFLYTCINQLSDECYPRNQGDLEQSHHVKLRQSLQGLRAEGS